MKSIRGRFTILVIISTVLLATLLGAVSVASLMSQADSDARDTINATCAYEASRIDRVLEGVEDAVNFETDYATDELAKSHKEDGISSLTDEKLKEIEDFFVHIATSTEGSVLNALRIYDGEGNTKGFLSARENGRGEFIFQSNIDNLLRTQELDVAAGWDEERLRAGESLWLEPVVDPAIPVPIAIYVRPLIVDGAYLGTVAMGIDFDIIVAQVESMSSYETGYGFMTDADGNVMYHPTIPFGTNLTEDDEEVPEVDKAIKDGTSTDIIVYTYHNSDKRMAFHLLQNNMRLVLSVEASEIFGNRDRLVYQIIGVTLFFVVAAIFVVRMFVKRALKPLNALTEAAEQVADHHLDVEILSSDYEEIARLIVAYQRTVIDYKRQVAYVEGLAHRDGLTGVFNKGAYDECCKAIDTKIKAGENPQFTIIMLDVNDLKGVNDNCGHMAGDDYLKAAAKCIGECFSDGTIYRIGGDEFVLMYEREATNEVREGIEKLQQAIRKTAAIEEPWKRIWMAYGVATYDEDNDSSVMDVFERADAAMYERKRQMKEGRPVEE